MKLKVLQVAIGKFHHFNTARELHRRQVLGGVLCGYPWAKLRDEGIPRKLVRTYPWLFTVYMGLNRFGWAQNRLGKEILWQSHESIDRWAQHQLGDANLLFGLSCSGLRAGQKMQARGGRYICDRGSTHIKYQERILREEFARWGQPYDEMDERVSEKESQEYATADKITVPTRHCKRSFVLEGVTAEKVEVVPYGVDVSKFYPVAKPEDGAFKVLFVGQISIRKGIAYLLEAFARFKHPRKELLIAGLVKDEARPILAKSSLDGVKFLGHLAHAELRLLMSQCHVMVLPSIEEGLAIVQGQALACGCPVIASEATGGEDLFTSGREGLIVPVRDAATIADGLTRLADQPTLRATMAANALLRVKELKGWGRYGDELQALFERTLKG